jgi:hypothetical protein
MRGCLSVLVVPDERVFTAVIGKNAVFGQKTVFDAQLPSGGNPGRDCKTAIVIGCMPTMRLRSLHPALLDRMGLLALWREGLLAQKVLLGQTTGYRFHTQLKRFQACRNPVAAISAYLSGIVDEARGRGYNFDASKIAMRRRVIRIPVTQGQLEFEGKLQVVAGTSSLGKPPAKASGVQSSFRHGTRAYPLVSAIVDRHEARPRSDCGATWCVGRCCPPIDLVRCDGRTGQERWLEMIKKAHRSRQQGISDQLPFDRAPC